MNKDNSTRQLPYLGFGLGLRVEHYETLLENPGPVEWLEVISENYMIPGGRPLVWLEKFRERFPLVMHGVSMSIGSTDPLDQGYLKRLAALAKRASVTRSSHLAKLLRGPASRPAYEG